MAIMLLFFQEKMIKSCKVSKKVLKQCVWFQVCLGIGCPIIAICNLVTSVETLSSLASIPTCLTLCMGMGYDSSTLSVTTYLVNEEV